MIRLQFGQRVRGWNSTTYQRRRYEHAFHGMSASSQTRCHDAHDIEWGRTRAGGSAYARLC